MATQCPKCFVRIVEDYGICPNCGAATQTDRSEHLTPLPLGKVTEAAPKFGITAVMPPAPQATTPPVAYWAAPPPAAPTSAPAPIYPAYTYADDLRRAAAMRSYVTPAVITLVLYFVFWLPGLIANLVYYFAARSDEQASGVQPQGSGCLTALFVFFVGLPIAGVAALIFLPVIGTTLSVLFTAAGT
jgi:hypothetical protein